MSRNYIGLSCSGHDNALAIVGSEGEVRFAEATERNLQSKRAIGAPPDDLQSIGALIERHCDPNCELVLCKTWSNDFSSFVAAAEQRAQRSIAELEIERTKSTSKAAAECFSFLEDRYQGYLQLTSLWRATSAMAGRQLKYRCRGRAFYERSYNHHLTHAATACFSSPFDDAVCAIVDGLGEGVSVSCFHYREGKLVPIPGEPVNIDEPFAGLGLFYADLCELCGFDRWAGEEWKVMGLAAYGSLDEQMHRRLHQCIRLNELGFKRTSAEPLTICKLRREWSNIGKGVARANLAHTGQLVFEELLIELCKRLRTLTSSRNLVLGGGCALNSSANGKLLEATGFERLHVPCAPADDGNALGAALLAYYEDTPGARPNTLQQTPYLGSSISEETLSRASSSGFARVVRLEEPALCDLVARRLAAGDLVGWVQGRAEFGPRALGNRSILADPRRSHMKQKINDSVKYREEFRPFAPAILAEDASDYFEAYQDSPYMERALRWRPSVRDRVSAVVHVDGTGRLQTVRQEWNPRFDQLIRCFRANTGTPLLLNTSFNVMGKPIIHSVEDALAVFTSTALDVLVIEDTVFEKQRKAPEEP